jgi:hypothetical protein
MIDEEFIEALKYYQFDKPEIELALADDSLDRENFLEILGRHYDQ